MIRSLFPRPKAPAIRGVHLYFSTESVIVAAISQNRDGVYFEQPNPDVMSGPLTPARLGAAFRKGFESFSIQDQHLRDEMRRDWPAFQASGLRSVKEFEDVFRPMQCYGLNPSNAVVRAAIQHPAHKDLELSVSFNPLLAPEEVGEKLLQLARAANAI